MNPSSASLTDRVRRRLVASGEFPTHAAVASAVRRESGVAVGDRDLLDLSARLRSDLLGSGPLEEFLADEAVTDVVVNGANSVWLDRGSGLERVPSSFVDDASVRRLAQRLAMACGRRLDDAHPWVDATLPDGTRIHAVLPPVARSGVCLSLRTFRRTAFTLDDLVASGGMSADSAALLVAIIRAKLTFLVTGGTGSGKTTLLGTLLGVVEPSERLVIVEDSPELRPLHPHVVTLCARPANAEGAGEVTLRDLVRQAMRMRPDRLIVGECRGAEVVELLAALNTGHEGCAGTLHANSPADVLARLEALTAAGGVGADALRSQVRAAVHCVVHVARGSHGRRLVEIGVLTSSGRPMDFATVWHADIGPGRGAPDFLALLASRGLAVPRLTAMLRGTADRVAVDGSADDDRK